MRILRPIVQPFVLAVFHVQAHVLARCAVGFELVRDHDARRPRGLLEQLPHKPLRGGSISSALNEDVENSADYRPAPSSQLEEWRRNRRKHLRLLPWR